VNNLDVYRPVNNLPFGGDTFGKDLLQRTREAKKQQQCEHHN